MKYGGMIVSYRTYLCKQRAAVNKGVGNQTRNIIFIVKTLHCSAMLNTEIKHNIKPLSSALGLDSLIKST